MSFLASFARPAACLRAAAWRAFALGAVLAWLPGAPTCAQQAAPPFSTLSLHAGINAPVGTGVLDAFYRTSPGLDVGLATPFYTGIAGLSVGLRRFEAREGQAREDLWAAPVALHWGVRPRLDPRLRADVSVRLGTIFMRFSSGGAGLKNESELLMGADAGLSLRLAGRWRLAVGARYERVFTSTPFPLWQVRAGLRRRFDAPRWFQTLLQ